MPYPTIEIRYLTVKNVPRWRGEEGRLKIGECIPKKRNPKKNSTNGSPNKSQPFQLRKTEVGYTGLHSTANQKRVSEGVQKRNPLHFLLAKGNLRWGGSTMRCATSKNSDFWRRKDFPTIPKKAIGCPNCLDVPMNQQKYQWFRIGRGDAFAKKHPSKR